MPYLLKDLDNSPEQVPQEEFVTASHRCNEIAQSKRGCVFLGIGKLVQTRHENTNHVECESERKILSMIHDEYNRTERVKITYHTIRVVPHPKPDPATLAQSSGLHAFRKRRYKVVCKRLLIVIQSILSLLRIVNGSGRGTLQTACRTAKRGSLVGVPRAR